MVEPRHVVGTLATIPLVLLSAEIAFWIGNKFQEFFYGPLDSPETPRRKNYPEQPSPSIEELIKQRAEFIVEGLNHSMVERWAFEGGIVYKYLDSGIVAKDEKGVYYVTEQSEWFKEKLEQPEN